MAPDWTERFPLIVEALNALKATTCLIDGEAVTCNETGRPAGNRSTSSLRGSR
jgi:ATP-dependent DNA ligase